MRTIDDLNVVWLRQEQSGYVVCKSIQPGAMPYVNFGELRRTGIARIKAYKKLLCKSCVRDFKDVHFKHICECCLLKDGYCSRCYGLVINIVEIATFLNLTKDDLK